MSLGDMDLGRSFQNSSVTIEERKKTLELYLQELALIPSIKESQQFKDFLEIERMCPEQTNSAILSIDFNS